MKPDEEQNVSSCVKLHKIQCRELWKTIPVSSVFNRRNVVCVDSEISAESALDILVRNSVPSAPVYCKKKASYCGTVTLRDVAAYVASLLRSDPTILQSRRPNLSNEEGEDEFGSVEMDHDRFSTCDGENTRKMECKSPLIKTDGCCGEEANNDKIGKCKKISGNFQRTSIPSSPILPSLEKKIKFPLKTLSDLIRHEQFITIQETGTMLEALETLASDVHCIFVVANQASQSSTSIEFVGILTQSDVVKYVCSTNFDNKNLHVFSGLLACRICDLGLSQPREIVSVKSFQRVGEALCEMQTNGVSSVAVVDPEGRLLGNISASDVKYIGGSILSMINNASKPFGINSKFDGEIVKNGDNDPADLSIDGYVLYQTCAHFVGVLKTRQMLANSGKETVPAIQVGPTANLGHVLKLMLVTNVHRVWVSEKNAQCSTFQIPTSVVSMTDFIRITI